MPRPSLIAATFAVAPLAVSAQAQDRVRPNSSDPTGEIVVTASRIDLLGIAATASEGVITRKEVELRPIFRPGQLLESIPGLVVTIHSGEGKANQYLIRGYNLDHGTDFANFVDDMPVNRPTNAHGQGYSDVAFLMRQIVGSIGFTKGPYHAAVGDFGSVASSHVEIANTIPDQLSATIGSNGYQNLFAGGTLKLAADRRLLGAVELSHFDGPWQPAQNFRKVNAALRYGAGSASDGVSLTAMYYKSAGLLTTDQPLRAIEAGSISRFGTLDPTDASRSERYSLSAHLAKPAGRGTLALHAYAIGSTMTLVNNFTHYLSDSVDGDQNKQDESRTTLGGGVSYAFGFEAGAIDSRTVIGVQVRYDSAFVIRQHISSATTVLGSCPLEREDGSVGSYSAVGGYCNADRVHLLDVAPYLENTTRWTPWLRTVVGIRETYYGATDTSFVTRESGSGHQWLFQPKGSLILGPWAKTELYVSAGRGFHSNDVRGVLGTVPGQGVPLAGGPTPFLSSTTGGEIGLRTNVVPRLSLQIAAFQQDFGSELVYNADSGQDEAGAPSRRQGVELSAQYRPVRWLELNGDVALSKPRYRAASLAAFGLAGPFIAGAPDAIVSAGVLVDNLGRWSGGLQWRRLGHQPISDGEREPTGKGYSEINLDIGYKLDGGWRLGLSVFNLFDSKDNAAEYYYTSRLLGEPPEGIAGYQAHPLEPRSARLTVTKTF